MLSKLYVITIAYSEKVGPAMVKSSLRVCVHLKKNKYNHSYISECMNLVFFQIHLTFTIGSAENPSMSHLSPFVLPSRGPVYDHGTLTTYRQCFWLSKSRFFFCLPFNKTPVE